MKKRHLLIVIALVFIMCLSFALMACSSKGIPNGTYSPCDENGKLSPYVLENCWRLRNNKAEYYYLKYKIIEIDGMVYFKYSSEETTIPDTQYKVEYDKTTKILTVYMPSKYGAEGASNGNDTEFHFRK